MSPKAFHEDMHVAIWEWIRDWCSGEHVGPDTEYPESPSDVLSCLIQIIGFCGGDSQDPRHPFVVIGGEEDWRGYDLFNFAEKMCQVGQRLYDEGLQEKLTYLTHLLCEIK